MTAEVLTHPSAGALTDLIYAAVDATRAYERIVAEDTAPGDAADWHARVTAAAEVDREATRAAVQAVRDLARSPR